MKYIDNDILSEQFFEQSPIGINLCTLDGKFLDSNPAFLEMIGYSKEEANAGLNYWQLTPPQYDEQEELQIENLKQTGRYGPYEKKFIRKDGTLISVRLNGFIVEKNDKKYIWSIVEDLTELKIAFQELKQANEKISETENFSRVVLENIPSMIIVKDIQNDFSYCLVNKAGGKFWNIETKNYLGKNCYDIFPKEKADEYTRIDKQIVKDKIALDVKHEEIETPFGKKIVSASRIPTFDEQGNPKYLIIISNDITEEIRAKEELEAERVKSIHNAKLASLGEMSAGVAHEISNPLAIIVGNLPLLNNLKDDQEKFTVKLNLISRSVDRISKIASSLKKFSRSGSNISLKNMKLCDIVEESIVFTEEKSQSFKTPVDAELKSNAEILCDEVEIQQVLINMIHNAIDAVEKLPEKWVQLRLFEKEDLLILQIRDSGPGIPPEVEKKMFQPFFTTKLIGIGTGLGLSIVKGILDNHKAKLFINRDDSHTCFEIQFPKV